MRDTFRFWGLGFKKILKGRKAFVFCDDVLSQCVNFFCWTNKYSSPTYQNGKNNKNNGIEHDIYILPTNKIFFAVGSCKKKKFAYFNMHYCIKNNPLNQILCRDVLLVDAIQFCHSMLWSLFWKNWCVSHNNSFDYITIGVHCTLWCKGCL